MIECVLIGGILGGWALLRLLGAEREKQLRVIQATVEAERRTAEEAAEAAAEVAAREARKKGSKAPSSTH